MQKESKLVKKFMVGTSLDIFGEEVVTDVSISMSSSVDRKQLLCFEGHRWFDTELEAMKHIEKCTDPFSIIQEVFVRE